MSYGVRDVNSRRARADADLLGVWPEDITQECRSKGWWDDIVYCVT